jgi:hypothetical protein
MENATESIMKAASRVHADSAVSIISKVSDRLRKEDVAALTAIASRIPWRDDDGCKICMALYETQKETGERAARRAMQDYRMIIEYFFEEQWANLLDATYPSDAKLDVVIEKALSLDGRTLSESTKKWMMEFWLFVCGMAATLDETKKMYLISITRKMKQGAKGYPRPAIHLIKLPPPTELYALDPELYNRVFGAESPAPASTKIDEAKLLASDAMSRCRGGGAPSISTTLQVRSNSFGASSTDSMDTVGMMLRSMEGMQTRFLDALANHGNMGNIDIEHLQKRREIQKYPTPGLPRELQQLQQPQQLQLQWQQQQQHHHLDGGAADCDTARKQTTSETPRGARGGERVDLMTPPKLSNEEMMRRKSYALAFADKEKATVKVPVSSIIAEMRAERTDETREENKRKKAAEAAPNAAVDVKPAVKPKKKNNTAKKTKKATAKKLAVKKLAMVVKPAAFGKAVKHTEVAKAGKTDSTVKAVGLFNPSYGVEYSRSRAQCRTGLKGPKQSFGFTYGKGHAVETQKGAEEIAEKWVEHINNGKSMDQAIALAQAS